ncbi:unnamed protein product [Pieris brassicae]|uniref:N-acetyltransferase domain-containing protein n=1 Tax=Pieris brassicae TaxID=7116 RepID=A0A9P0SJW4_PIEBR|nr:unnamed protein product [Pieris brassicae]
MEGGTKIRHATKEDMDSVADMIQELADFEKVEKGPNISGIDLRRDGFETDPPLFRCLVAEQINDRQKELVGYALYFSSYSTWQGRALMLRDIFIKERCRKQGVGKKLFNAVAKVASSSGCSRLEFHVLGWNDARLFYKSRGARDLTAAEAWRYYRLDDDALHAAAREADIIH